MSEYSLINRRALIGAFYMRFVLADKYLCITSKGDLYAASNKSNECLWLNEKLISAQYSNMRIEIKKNCKLSVLLDTGEHVYAEKNECSGASVVTSGFSRELQIFFLSCQSSLQRSAYKSADILHFNYASSTRPSSTSKQSMLSHLLVFTVAPVQSTTKPQLKRKKATRRKCFGLRRTPMYRQCMANHYKCFKFRNDTNKFKECKSSLKN